MSYHAFGAQPAAQATDTVSASPPPDQAPRWLVPVAVGGAVVLVVGLMALSVYGNYKAGEAFAPEKEDREVYGAAGAFLGTKYGLGGLALLAGFSLLSGKGEAKASDGLGGFGCPPCGLPPPSVEPCPVCQMRGCTCAASGRTTPSLLTPGFVITRGPLPCMS